MVCGRMRPDPLGMPTLPREVDDERLCDWCEMAAAKARREERRESTGRDEKDRMG